MKLLFAILFLINLDNNTKYYVRHCAENKLNIEIAENYNYKKDVVQNGNQDLFTIMHPDSSVKYLINIIRTKSPVPNFEYLKSEEYKESFSDSNTKVEEVKEIKCKAFTGVRFLKRITTSKRVFLSYSISTLVEGELFVITYNTVENNFYKYEEEFNHSLNSIKFD